MQFSPVPFHRPKFHVNPNMRTKDQLLHWIPSVVLLQPSDEVVREIRGHPRPSTEKRGESEGSTCTSTEPKHTTNREARTKGSQESSGKQGKIHFTNFWTEPVGQACASRLTLRKTRKTASMLPQAPRKVAESEEK